MIWGNKSIFEFMQKIDIEIIRKGLNVEPYPRKTKSSYLEELHKTGYFSFLRKICFSTGEIFDANRFTKLALSQGKVYNAIKMDTSGELISEWNEFRQKVEEIFNKKMMEFRFSYTVYLGINI